MWAPLASKAKRSGGLSFQHRNPGLGSPVWGSDPSLLGENLCNCNYPQVCGSSTGELGSYLGWVSALPASCLVVVPSSLPSAIDLPSAIQSTILATLLPGWSFTLASYFENILCSPNAFPLLTPTTSSGRRPLLVLFITPSQFMDYFVCMCGLFCLQREMYKRGIVTVLWTLLFIVNDLPPKDFNFSLFLLFRYFKTYSEYHLG